MRNIITITLITIMAAPVFGQLAETPRFRTPKIAAKKTQPAETSLLGPIRLVRYESPFEDNSPFALPDSSSLPSINPFGGAPDPKSLFPQETTGTGAAFQTETPPLSVPSVDTQYPETRPQIRTTPMPLIQNQPQPEQNLMPKAPSILRPQETGMESMQRIPRAVTSDKPCPETNMKSINDISHSIVSKSTGPFPRSCPISVDDDFPQREGECTTVHWKASALYAKGSVTYFEDPALERYGHSMSPTLQPVVSGAKFFLTLPVLPYKMGITMPNECVYDLGYHRPGSCAPYMLNPFPISFRGALLEAGAVLGVAHVFP